MLRGDYDQHMREAWVWMCDRFVPYPFQNNIHRLPRDVFLECILGIIDAQKCDLSRDNFENWIKSVFGAGIAKYFMTPYNFKVWAHPLRDDVRLMAGRPSAERRRLPHPREPSRRPR